MGNQRTVIVSGASQGIGAAVVQAFLDRGYNVVATSRSVSKAGFAPSPNLALVDGDIGQATTAEKVAQTAIAKFGAIDHVVNNAGSFVAKSFTEYTADDFRGLASTNLEGFIFITQLRSQANPVAGRRWKCDNHHGVAAREPNRRPSGIGCDGHKRWT